MKFINRNMSSPKSKAFFPRNQVKTKKKVFAENWSAFSPKSGEDQKIHTLKDCESGHVLSV